MVRGEVYDMATLTLIRLLQQCVGDKVTAAWEGLNWLASGVQREGESDGKAVCLARPSARQNSRESPGLVDGFCENERLPPLAVCRRDNDGLVTSVSLLLV